MKFWEQIPDKLEGLRKMKMLTKDPTLRKRGDRGRKRIAKGRDEREERDARAENQRGKIAPRVPDVARELLTLP